MGNSNTVDVIRAFMGTEIDVITVENDFSNYQIVAGEQIKLTGLPEGILLIPDTSQDESLKPNIILLDENDSYTVITGNAYFVAVDEHGDVVSLSNEQIEIIMNWIIDSEYINICNFNFEGRKESC